jgi:hypothetical protein
MSSFRYELPARLGLEFPQKRGVEEPLRPRAVEPHVEFAELNVPPVLRVAFEVANHGRHDDRSGGSAEERLAHGRDAGRGHLRHPRMVIGRLAVDLQRDVFRDGAAHDARGHPRARRRGDDGKPTGRLLPSGDRMRRRKRDADGVDVIVERRPIEGRPIVGAIRIVAFRLVIRVDAHEAAGHRHRLRDIGSGAGVSHFAPPG